MTVKNNLTVRETAVVTAHGSTIAAIHGNISHVSVIIVVVGAIESGETRPGGQNALQHAVAASADQQRTDADQAGARRSRCSVGPCERRLVGQLVLLTHGGLRTCITTWG